MHWISLIGFFTIIYLCQSQPTIYKNFETGNMNKGGTFQRGSNGNNVGWFESKNNLANFPYTSTEMVPTGHNTLKLAANGGNNHQCYMVLSLMIAVFMTMIHF